MGIVEIDQQAKQFIIHSVFFFYGNAAGDSLSEQVANDITVQWNAPAAHIVWNKTSYRVLFNCRGIYAPQLTRSMVIENTNPVNNYFRIETFAHGNISYVDGLGCNTGYFLLDNLLHNSTTAAHEYGHSLGLDHPELLDIRGRGVPGIMYPRGTITDPAYQYSPLAAPLAPGGTMNPLARKVKQEDIDHLQLQQLSFDKNGLAVLGAFSSVWHEAHKQH